VKKWNRSHTYLKFYVDRMSGREKGTGGERGHSIKIIKDRGRGRKDIKKWHRSHTYPKFLISRFSL
jgi:hypothetical protein